MYAPLFNLLGYRDSSLWQRQLDQIVSRSGLFQILTHPDPDYLGRPTIARAYRELLHVVAERDVGSVAA